MIVTAETPRAERTIAGITVLVPAPYAEGHVLTSGEARALNQTLAENFSNNLRSRGQTVEGEGEAQTVRDTTPEEMQAFVDKYAETYEMGAGRGEGSRKEPVDPIEREVRALARVKANELLAERGIKRKDLGAEKYDALVDGVIAKIGDQLRPQAKKIVDQRNKATGGEFDLTGLLEQAA